jgi:putative ABC transport system substrate-binding protein
LGLLALALGCVASAAWPQQAENVPIVGNLMVGAMADDPMFVGLQRGLRELGYVEGRNLRLEFRTAEGHPDRLPRLALELVKLEADVIVVMSPQAARAVRQASTAVPIVVATFDPVDFGLATSLARPEGQVTGMSSTSTELYPKRLQLLKEMVPGLTRVGVLWNPATPPRPWHAKVAEDLKATGPPLSITLSFFRAGTPEELESAFAAMKQARCEGVYVVEDPFFYNRRETVAQLALKAKLPAVYGTKAYLEGGGLISYGVDYAEQARQAATYVDRILKGAKPAELPIEQPTKFELVLNVKTAKALGIAIPQSIVMRADAIIR